MTRTGPRNLITDVGGLRVGNASDDAILTGVTVLLPEKSMVVGADIRGGAPGTRETPALAPENLVDDIHAIVLSGGSVFGLDAASEVTSALARQGKGFAFGQQAWPCPVVPAAILFDLMNGGDKDWGPDPPYRRLGREALAAASAQCPLGNVGAGAGAVAGALKGGLGSASCLVDGFTVGALVAVNSIGSCVDPQTGQFWSLPHAVGGEMGPGAGRPAPGIGGTKLDRLARAAQPGANTTLAIVATDAVLTKAEARRLAIMAGDGLAIAIRPLHTPFDGDSVFAAATCLRQLPPERRLALAQIGAAAAVTLARAVGRALWHAAPAGGFRSYRDILGA
ncbi:MAG: P1 family peptidase [Alphaproteobacteria bacterium]|nr:P1 family peptidase [Alphaproteobacteria bacterium]